MSYQVLARKWRPKSFREMVGQAHVLKALINALDHDRLHHAYLFTGTRGVGKTTIARIFAKCLNCETGVSSEPCNQCSACNEINEGRFVDLIEVDAASRTKVEDTRELLDNVQYAPSRGRYKVYLIDEVHMLSNSSFNALLKTLEEPPPHVKFLLATTDPQKLPVTILSRCLQFNLKNMSPERIVEHLKTILEKEMIPFEEAALWQLGRSADGSMRDALSLTDQGIAFGGGKITDKDIRSMLGTIDQSLVFDVLKGLIAEDPVVVLQAVDDLSEHAPDYPSVLAELINVLHRVAIAQAVPEAIDNSLGDRQQIYHFAQSISSEDVQLYYQTALLGRRDLPLVPDARAGFEMILLRMLAFKPQGVADLPKKPLLAPATNMAVQDETLSSIEGADNDTEEEPSTSVKKPELVNQPDMNQADDRVIDTIDTDTVPVQTHPQDSGSEVESTVEPSDSDRKAFEEFEKVAQLSSKTDSLESDETNSVDRIPKNPIDQSLPKVTITPLNQQSAKKIQSPDVVDWQNWDDLFQQLSVEGILRNTLLNCDCQGYNDNQLNFILDEGQSALYDPSQQSQLSDLLEIYFQQSVQVSIIVGTPVNNTPAKLAEIRKQLRQQEAEKAIINDPLVKQFQQVYGATIVEGSIEPIDKHPHK